MEGVSIPVLQEETADTIFDDYGASKWYFYFIDRDGNPRAIHYRLDLEDELPILLGEIQKLVEET